MAYSPKQWEIVRAFFENGLSLAEIVARPESQIKDRSSISKRAKSEGWIKGKNSTLLNSEVELKQNVTKVEEQKSTLNSTELLIHNTLVDERTKHINYFNSEQLKLSKMAMDKVDESTKPGKNGKRTLNKITFQELKHASEVVQKSREGILGKAPDVAVQVNNINNPQQYFETPVEFKEAAKELFNEIG